MWCDKAKAGVKGGEGLMSLARPPNEQQTGFWRESRLRRGGSEKQAKLRPRLFGLEKWTFQHGRGWGHQGFKRRKGGAGGGKYHFNESKIGA